ncbi:MAG: hypothetical protein C0497_13265 [Gemmatimonas sp.]|nr:hypothetical protein [Gemmatimonas sp.]
MQHEAFGQLLGQRGDKALPQTMKTERCHRTHYPTREVVCTDVFECIERFQNPIRMHSTQSNKSPINCERAAAT